MENKIKTYDFLWKSTKGKRAVLGFFILTDLLNDVLGIFVAQYFNRKMVNYLSTNNAVFAVGLELIILYAVLDKSAYLIKSVRERLKINSLFKIIYNIRNKLFKHMVQHSMAYFNDSFSGALNNKIISAAKNSGLIIETTCKLIGNMSVILLTPILYTQINIYLGVAFTIIALLYLYFLRKLRKEVANKSKNLAEEKSNYFALINDDLTNIINIKSFSRNFKEINKIKRQNVDILRKDFEFKKTSAKFLLARFVLAFTLYSVIFVIAGILLYQRKIMIGDFLYVTIITAILNYVIKNFSEKLMRISIAKGALENNLEAILQPIEITDKKNAKKLIISNGRIIFKNINFNYKRRENEIQQ